MKVKNSKPKTKRIIKNNLKQLSLFEVISTFQSIKSIKVNRNSLPKTSSKNPYILKDAKGAFFL